MTAAATIDARLGDAHRQAVALVAALRDAANYANRNPHEGFPGVGDLDDLTDKAAALEALLEELA